jgi:nucleoside 2-deoxyribosyltransferase
MKFYIAGHNQQEAKKIADLVISFGHTVTSTWIYKDLNAENQLDEIGKTKIANKDVREVLEADAMIIFSSPLKVPGGKFVECGVAIGANKRIFLIGHRENFLMYHESIETFNFVEYLLMALKRETNESQPAT